MKVREPIEALQELDGDDGVHFTYNYGDRWRTQVAPEVEYVEDRSLGLPQHAEGHRRGGRGARVASSCDHRLNQRYRAQHGARVTNPRVFYG